VRCKWGWGHGCSIVDPSHTDLAQKCLGQSAEEIQRDRPLNSLSETAGMGCGARRSCSYGDPKRHRSKAFISKRGVRPITRSAIRSAVTAARVRPRCWCPTA
jgi:hypothetical protein